MRKFKHIIIIISLFVAFSALNITNSAMTNACRCRPNHKPKLSEGHVIPSEGDQTTLFTYSVNYKDKDNDKPVFIYVIINWRFYRMQKQDPSDNDYTDGCIYTYSRYLEPGNYRYFFLCYDGHRLAWTCIKCGPTVFCNDSPILCDGKVAPELGEKSIDVFNFSVNYIDENNDAPEFLNITLDGTNHTMTKADPCDCNYEDGCIYYYTTTLDEIGIHQFRFYTSDGHFWTFTETFEGPTVQDTITPDLTCLSPLNTTYTSGIIDINVSSTAIDVDRFWYTLYDISSDQWIGYPNGTVIEGGHATVDLETGFYKTNVFVNDTAGNINSTVIYFTIANAPILSDGQVSPSSGERWLTLFNFTVIYTDEDNNPPTFLNITLDGVNHTMIKADPFDCNYEDGCIYYYATVLEDVGIHYFKFYTSDGIYWIFSETFFDPTVQDSIAPDLICSSPLNITYTSGNIDIMVSSSAIDVDLFWYTLYDISKDQWIGYPNGTVIEGGHAIINLGTGFYLINVFVNDTIGNVNSTAIYFTVANPPILSDGQVSPSMGERWLTLFNFTVIYTDEDNNPPTFLNISLDGTNYTMIKVDPLDCNYEDGCIYYYTTLLEEVGIYEFRFYTSDGIYWSFSDLICGPAVQDTIAPDLNCLSPLNITYTSGIIDINVLSTAIDVDNFFYTLYDITNEQWIGSQDGIIIIGGHATVQLGTGYYLITTFVNDTAGNVNSTAIYFTVANPPILFDGQVSPSMGERWLTLFNFTVTYTDEDNSPPTFLNISLDGVNFTMIKVDLEDNNYEDGCIYYYITTLEEIGIHQFSFYTSDGTYSTFTDIYDCPTVQDTTPPDIIIISPLDTTYSTGSILINVSSNALDVDSYWYLLYGLLNGGLMVDPNGVIIEDGLATLNLEDGYYLITIFANDTEGNINEVSVYFTVAIDAPIITPPLFWMLVGIGSTIGAGAVVSIVVIKRRKSKAQKYHHDKIFKKQKGGLSIFQDNLNKLEKDLEEKLGGLEAPPSPPPKRDLNMKKSKETDLPEEL